MENRGEKENDYFFLIRVGKVNWKERSDRLTHLMIENENTNGIVRTTFNMEQGKIAKTSLIMEQRENLERACTAVGSTRLINCRSVHSKIGSARRED